MIKSRPNVRCDEWAKGHYAWPLVQCKELSIKLEEIPAGGKSERHHHLESFQFFFILKGQAVGAVEGKKYFLNKHEGIEIFPRKSHQILNRGRQKLLFLVVSAPSVKKSDIYC